MRYDHNNYGHRLLLAASIKTMLEDNNFSDSTEDSDSEVFMDRKSDCLNFAIRVSTTICPKKNMMRSVGKSDTIKVFLLKKVTPSFYEYILKPIVIFRMGNINDISKNILDAILKLDQEKHSVCGNAGAVGISNFIKIK